MRKLHYMLFVAIFFFSCEKDEEQKKYFSETCLGQLKLDSLEQFWDNGETFAIYNECGSDVYTRSLNTCIAGMGMWNGKKLTWVNVYLSGEEAVEAMEFRISQVPANIVEGSGHGITSKWWIEEGSDDPAIFVNKWNTIIELNYLIPPEEEVGDKLYVSALEIANRVDSLSTVIE